MRVESVVYRGITFRRYPDSERLADRRYYRPNGTHIANGVEALHREIWRDYHGSIPVGWHIHHIDGDPDNNHIDNLECLPPFDHLSHHGTNLSDEQLAQRRQNMDKARIAAAAWHRSDEGRAWHRAHGREGWLDRQPTARVCEQCGGTYLSRAIQRHNRFCSNKCKSAWRRASGVDDEDRTCPVCGRTFRVNRYSRKRACSRVCGSRLRTDRAPGRL